MLLEKLQTDLKSALKNGQTQVVGTLRFLMADIKNAQIAKRKDLTDEEILCVIQKQIKNRNDSIDAFSKGSRPDLADKEKQEAAILTTYLPEQISDEALTGLIQETINVLQAYGRQDIGRVMGEIVPKLQGRADKGRVAKIASSILEKA